MQPRLLFIADDATARPCLVDFISMPFFKNTAAKLLIAELQSWRYLKSIFSQWKFIIERKLKYRSSKI